jgi:hypothetical protein
VVAGLVNDGIQFLGRNSFGAVGKLIQSVQIQAVGTRALIARGGFSEDARGLDVQAFIVRQAAS